MNPKQPFKWRHFQDTIILLNVRWYLRYPLSYRNLQEMMLGRVSLWDRCLKNQITIGLFFSLQLFATQPLVLDLLTRTKYHFISPS